MKLKSIVSALVLCAGAPAMAATCSSTFSLGILGPGDVTAFGNSFNSAQSFNDCYAFTLNASADALGVTLEWDWSQRLNIDVTSAALSGSTLGSVLTDATPTIISFSGLTSGTYQLMLSGLVTDAGRGYTGFGVGYAGLLSTSAPTVVTPVPEPESLAMLALGLGAVALSVRRRRA